MHFLNLERNSQKNKKSYTTKKRKHIQQRKKNNNFKFIQICRNIQYEGLFTYAINFYLDNIQMLKMVKVFNIFDQLNCYLSKR
jgi:hypothetical protein